MPDFYYKSKSETKSAPATAPRSKSGKKETKKVAVNGTKKKVETEEKKESSVRDESFTRNSRKYATMPAKRTSDIITVEADNYSDTEQVAESDEDSPSR